MALFSAHGGFCSKNFYPQFVCFSFLKKSRNDEGFQRMVCVSQNLQSMQCTASCQIGAKLPDLHGRWCFSAPTIFTAANQRLGPKSLCCPALVNLQPVS